MVTVIQEMSDSEREFIQKLRSDPVYAAFKLLNVKLVPHQRLMLKGVWDKKFNLWVISRALGKSFMLAVFAALRALLFPEERIVIVAASFRQSLQVFNYVEKLLRNSVYFRQALLREPKHNTNEHLIELKNGSTIVAIPLGPDGRTIRGYRATVILIDETAQVPEEIIQQVLLPFMAVVKNPIAEYFGEETDDPTNVLVMASSAYYQFNHLYKLYLLWRKKVLDGDPDWDLRQYNYLDAPKGFIDEKVIEFQKANSTKDQFKMEMLAEFPSDSHGFYPSSLIQSCIVKGVTPVLKARKDCVYVLGVDPAREDDLFALTVLEIFNDEFRVGYCRAWKNISFPEMVNKIDELDTYFNFARIGLDAGGGGLAIRDLLGRERYITMPDGRVVRKEPYLVIGDKLTQNTSGKRNIELVSFNSQVINEMNFSLKRNFENRRLIFPSQAIFSKSDADDLELRELIMENIFQLRFELESVQTSLNQNGYLRFFVPENVKKDRYSSLLLANRVAEQIVRESLSLKSDKEELPFGFWVEGFTIPGRWV